MVLRRHCQLRPVTGSGALLLRQTTSLSALPFRGACRQNQSCSRNTQSPGSGIRGLCQRIAPAFRLWPVFGEVIVSRRHTGTRSPEVLQALVHLASQGNGAAPVGHIHGPGNGRLRIAARLLFGFRYVQVAEEGNAGTGMLYPASSDMATNRLHRSRASSWSSTTPQMRGWPVDTTYSRVAVVLVAAM